MNRTRNTEQKQNTQHRKAYIDENTQHTHKIRVLRVLRDFSIVITTLRTFKEYLKEETHNHRKTTNPQHHNLYK